MHRQRFTFGIITFHFWFYVTQEHCIYDCFHNNDLCIIPVFIFQKVHSGGMLLSLLTAQLLCAVGVLRVVFRNIQVARFTTS